MSNAVLRFNAHQRRGVRMDETAAVASLISRGYSRSAPASRRLSRDGKTEEFTWVYSCAAGHTAVLRIKYSI